MVTCGTYLKRHHFQSFKRLRLLCEALQPLAAKYSWNLQAWAVFSNHYHWVGLSPRDCDAAHLRQRTAHGDINRIERGRPHSGKTSMVSVLGDTPHLSTLVRCAAELRAPQRRASLAGSRIVYPWSSAGWFERRATASFYKTIMRFGIERLKVPDEFEVVWLPEGG
jgi:putative transposase